jgi:hypothetical protein
MQDITIDYALCPVAICVGQHEEAEKFVSTTAGIYLIASKPAPFTSLGPKMGMEQPISILKSKKRA